MAAKNSRLFYWQEDSVGYLPIDERVTIPSVLGDPVQLGVGGVIDRFDEASDYFGNQHQFGLVDTPYGS